MIDISFTTTAMRRPGVLAKTYRSFMNNLQGIQIDQCDLFLNIDPLPDDTDSDKVYNVARKFFRSIIVRTPKKPNFAKAVKWCWSQPTTEYIFHLEDDWRLAVPIDFNAMLQRINIDKKVYQVALRSSGVKNGLTLMPSIIHREMYMRFANKFVTNVNPEVQMRKQTAFAWEDTDPIHKTDTTIYYPDDVVVRDIGRGWMSRSPYERPGSAFNSWVKNIDSNNKNSCRIGKK